MFSEKEIIKIFQEKDLKILKNLGQNFLTDEKVLEKIIQSSDLKKNDVVLEIGPGLGALTKKLAGRCKTVIAVEKDKKLAELLKEKLCCEQIKTQRCHKRVETQHCCVSTRKTLQHNKNIKNIEVVNSDILQMNIDELVQKYSQNRKYKLISNIPYYITSPIIKLFLESNIQPEIVVLLAQKEVAERICASKGKLSILALSVQIYGEPEIIDYVDKSSFYPEPKVDSAILRIKNIKKEFPSDYYKKIFRIIKIGFSSKRKKLVNNLSAGLRIEKKEAEELLSKAGINFDVRAQELELKDWKKLAEIVLHNT
jgi:16S rRNA (adenine1518-N6/adenine1519-N6)-dimethyltransferase